MQKSESPKRSATKKRLLKCDTKKAKKSGALEEDKREATPPLPGPDPTPIEPLEDINPEDMPNWEFSQLDDIVIMKIMGKDTLKCMTVVGFVQFDIRNGEILLLSVNKRFRRRGYGKLLVRVACNMLKANEFKKVVLRVKSGRTNIAAVALYTKEGFRFFGDPAENMMEKDLTQ